ncbi:hypothetical protein C8K44_101189 [Aminobacter sp. AP02]|nr:hypothetical protein C8K44_101189 [Aminobacter sp. AP02]
MRPFHFGTRTPARDRETDQLRFHRLLEALTELSVQLDHETAGLQARYVRASDDAAFSFQELENGGGAGLSSKVDDLTISMARCLARIAALQGQVAFIEMLRQSVISYAEDMAIDGAGEDHSNQWSHH